MVQNKQNIVLTRKWPASVEQALVSAAAPHGVVQLREPDSAMSRDELANALRTADVLCATVTDQIDEELLKQPECRTKLIANFGVGVNHIDLAAAQAAGISISNTPGVLTEATAEIALTLLLSAARRTGEGERLVRSGGWSGWYPTHMLSTQVTGKKLGIIGMGRIGLDLARKAHHGLGMKIFYHNRSALPSEVAASLGAERLTLEELLTRSDFVSLNCPATPETRHLINAETLALMQAHCILINTARGDVVDEKALCEALEKKQIAAAGLDVYEQEPVLTPGLLALDNVVLLPHMGSGTTQTREAMGQCAMRNVIAWLRGEPLPNGVA